MNPQTILPEGYVIVRKENIQVTGYRGTGNRASNIIA